MISWHGFCFSRRWLCCIRLFCVAPDFGGTCVHPTLLTSSISLVDWSARGPPYLLLASVCFLMELRRNIFLFVEVIMCVAVQLTVRPQTPYLLSMVMIKALVPFTTWKGLESPLIDMNMLCCWRTSNIAAWTKTPRVLSRFITPSVHLQCWI